MGATNEITTELNSGGVTKINRAKAEFVKASRGNSSGHRSDVNKGGREEGRIDWGGCSAGCGRGSVG